MAKSSQPWDLNPIMEAFQKAMGSKTNDANFDELSLRVKDLKETFKELIQFFKTQGLYNKELGNVIKNAIEFEKTQTKSKKGQGISQDTSMLHLSQEISKYFSLSAQGKSKAFNIDDNNPLVKAMKDNLSVYDKLISSINDLQKSMAKMANSTGGKLNQSMQASGGKDSSSGGFLGALAGLFNKKGSGKDTDIKDATPKGDGFMKGIGTLIGFLGGRGDGFLGKLSKVLSEYATKTGIDALKLAIYGIFSIFRTFGGKEGIRDAIKLAIKYALPGASRLGGAAAKALAKTKLGKAAIKSAVGAAGKFAEKIGGKAAGKAATKAAGKALAKGLGKSVAKKIPGVSLLAGVGFAADRLIRDKDWKGAGLELLSGAAGTIPGLGTAASVGIDAALVARDVKRASEKATQVNQEGFEGIDRQAKKQEETEKKKMGILEWFKDWWPWGKDKDNKDNTTLGGGTPGGTPGGGDPGAPGKKLFYEPKSFEERKKAASEFYLSELRRLEGLRGSLSDDLINRKKAELAKVIREKFGVVPEVYKNGLVDIGAGVDSWGTLNPAKMQSRFSKADPNAVNAIELAVKQPTNVGSGQSYSASSAGGSALGDAFFGGDLAKISAGGGFGQKGHRGIDLPYPGGTAVHAFLPGTVVWASYGNKANKQNGGFGNVIGIKDDVNGMVNIYAHLRSIEVKNGQKVKRGQKIGVSGNTGYGVSRNKGGTLADHLHFEVRPSTAKGGSVDPVAYVASALGYSVDSLPDSGPMFADSSTSEGSRSVSEPKGVTDESSSTEVASASSEQSIDQVLKDAYANNQFDQTGNTQFLAAINSIRVQLGKYQHIGMVV